ncbi:MAG: pilus assembly protein PilM [Clostridium sp.]|uniref:pilus assembly protein PilM n=1 Tax=Clostridium sp. TaxID=1506 RepID=UPI00290C8110|nr:pilus assembly protein PilM [Clostridium sp.]MDU7338253.1 pilus assembly protein PilM [Clostridium sp.]
MAYLGLDVGTGTVKLAVVKGTVVQKLYCSMLTAELPREGQRVACSDALASELRELLKREKISVKSCALVLPPEAAFVRRVIVPVMTEKQLKVNLPYEFHDYIQQGKEEYFYDYAVVDTLEDPTGGDAEKLDLLIAATPKSVIRKWRAMLRRAGLRLSVAVPEYLTYRNLIRVFEQANPEDHPKEYCIADLGYRSIRVHMYRGCAYETTRVIEYSDVPVRQLAMGPQEDADRLSVREHYSQIAVEILRAVNFYGFNTPGSDLKDIYFCGRLASSPELMQILRDTLRLNIHSVAELLPNDDTAAAELCPEAVGAALEMSGR